MFSLQKLRYFAFSLKKNILNKGFACPSCGNLDSKIISRKYLITALHNCNICKLLYRTPTTTKDENEIFYQNEYTQGFTTECPNDEKLSFLLNKNFQGEEKDYSSYIDIIKAGGGVPKHRLFDYGCSWGYGSWQLKRCGFDVESFDISIPMANYAKSKLGLKVHFNLSDVKGIFDIFFASHVLEHVPSVKETINFGMNIIKPNGLFVAFTPNGSLKCKNKIKNWNKHWGLVHPQFINEDFYANFFSNNDYFIASTPYTSNIIKEIQEWKSKKTNRQVIKQNCGSEMMIIVVK